MFDLCFLCNEYPGPIDRFGGIGVVMKTEAEWFAARGHSVHIIIEGKLDHPDYVLPPNIVVHNVTSNMTPKAGALLTRMRVARKAREILGDRPAVVVCADYEGVVVNHPFRQPLIVQLQGCSSLNAVQMGRKPRWQSYRLERRTIQLGDVLHGASRFGAEKTLQVLDLDLPVELIPNSVDVSSFAPASPDEVRTNRIVFVGKMSTLKGALVLAHAFASLSRQVPDCELALIGQDAHENGRSVLEQFFEIVPAEAHSRVFVLGRQSREQVAEHIRRSAVLVLPSYTEVLPTVVLEAMASGRPVVGSRRGGIPELVTDGVNGLLAEPKEPETFAAALGALITNSENAFEMGRAGRERAVREFSTDVVFGKKRESYLKALQKRGFEAAAHADSVR